MQSDTTMGNIEGGSSSSIVNVKIDDDEVQEKLN